MKLRLLLTLICSGAAFSLAGQNLVGEFEFNGNLNDNQGNCTLTSFQNNPLSYDSGFCRWQSDSSNNGGGFVAKIPSNLLNPKHYSVLVRINYPKTLGYRKLMDFGGLKSDQGIYINGSLRIYSSGKYGTTNISQNQWHDILFVRDSSFDVDSGYCYLLDSGLTLLESFAGLSQFEELNIKKFANNYIINFFNDDSITYGEYTPSGKVDRIRIWNGVINPKEALGLTQSSIVEAKIYPNPASKNVQLAFNKNYTGNLQLVNVYGQCVYSRQVQNCSQIEIETSQLPAGIYTIFAGNYCGKLMLQNQP